MSVVRFDPRRPRSTSKRARPSRDVITPLLTFVAVAAVCALGWVVVDGQSPVTTAVTTTGSADGKTAHFEMCGRDRYTCVVDGDTIWLDGVNLRLQSFDTPESYTNICGGAAEVALAKRASARLLELLNQQPFTVQTYGLDNTGKRTLATVRVQNRDVGDILIEEGLARRWPDGDEFWC